MTESMKPIALPMNNIKLPRYNEEGEVSGFGITEGMHARLKKLLKIFE